MASARRRLRAAEGGFALAGKAALERDAALGDAPVRLEHARGLARQGERIPVGGRVEIAERDGEFLRLRRALGAAEDAIERLENPRLFRLL